eukprot:Opistho-2@65406
MIRHQSLPRVLRVHCRCRSARRSSSLPCGHTTVSRPSWLPPATRRLDCLTSFSPPTSEAFDTPCANCTCHVRMLRMRGAGTGTTARMVPMREKRFPRKSRVKRDSHRLRSPPPLNFSMLSVRSFRGSSRRLSHQSPSFPSHHLGAFRPCEHADGTGISRVWPLQCRTTAYACTTSPSTALCTRPSATRPNVMSRASSGVPWRERPLPLVAQRVLCSGRCQDGRRRVSPQMDRQWAPSHQARSRSEATHPLSQWHGVPTGDTSPADPQTTAASSSGTSRRSSGPFFAGAATAESRAWRGRRVGRACLRRATAAHSACGKRKTGRAIGGRRLPVPGGVRLRRGLQMAVSFSSRLSAVPASMRSRSTFLRPPPTAARSLPSTAPRRT